MKIYTSYFANIRNHPDKRFISIAVMSPHWFKGPTYKELTPPWYLVKGFKADQITEATYTQIYNNAVLDKLDPMDVVEDMFMFDVDDQRDIVLCCWEAKGKFCHRHLVSYWLTPAADVKEL